MVAESTLIFAPISQLGWATACSGVAFIICSISTLRNGPPEAVRIIRATLASRLKSKTWNIALCSESTGSKVAPARATSLSINSPAQTRHSLLARPTIAPRLTASMVGPSPAAPTIPAITKSAGPAAASSTALGPAAALTFDPESESLSSL